MPDTDNADTNGGAIDETALERFVNRYEALDEDEKNIKDDKKTLLEEVASSGYDKKIFRMVIALRKREPDDVAEEEAALDMYKSALKMQ
jgi:uncharacterized protein (UPF0335 family)